MLFRHIFISDKKYAFKDLFKTFYASQLLFAMKLVGNRHDAEDVVQDVFYRIWRSKPVFKNEIAFKSYLYLTTRNRSIDIIRKRRVKFQELDYNHEIPDEIDYIVKEETLRLLEEAVEKLPSQTKEVIKRSMKGMSVQQVADSLNISVNTVKTLKSRAYRILKDSYGNIFTLLISTYLYNF